MTLITTKMPKEPGKRTDLASLLKSYLEKKYPSVSIRDKGKGRAHLILPSNTILHVRGTRKSMKTQGFTSLLEEDYKDTVNSLDQYLTIVYVTPENTIVLPGSEVREIFGSFSPRTYGESKPQWKYYVKKENGRHKIQIQGQKPYDVEDFLNKWHQIPDYADYPPRERPNSGTGSSPKVLLTGYTEVNLQHSIRNNILGWRDRSHILSSGDLVFIYNKDNKTIDAGFRIKTKSNNLEPIWEEEITSQNHDIQFIDRWDAELLCNKLNIDLETVNRFEPFRGRVPTKFIPLVGNNFATPLAFEKYSEFRKFLLESCNRLDNVSAVTTPYFLLRMKPNSGWRDKEGEEYHFDTDVPRDGQIVAGSKIIFDRNIEGELRFLGYGEIGSIKEEDRKRTNSQGRPVIDKIASVKNYVKFDPPLLRSPEMQKALEALPGYNNQHAILPISKELYDVITEGKAAVSGNRWQFDWEAAIDEILGKYSKKELAIDRRLVRRIILHLKAGKNVLLVGPPGVGKTELAQRILKVIGRHVIGDGSPLEAVASDEWTTHKVIGSLDLNGTFQNGYVTQAVVDHKWLLIDEFNRANMNKAFGEMFMAIEHGKITLGPAEKKASSRDVIEIPADFRMICTMNDFDKNLLLTELSYGLISRFAFVSVIPDTEREPIVIKDRVMSELGVRESDYLKFNAQIIKYFEFINVIREKRIIGVRTSLDIVRYLVSAHEAKDESSSNIEEKEVERWSSLNDALCDYLLPQFDRLDKEVLDHAFKAASTYFVFEPLKPFQNELNSSAEKLNKAANWLIKENDK